MGFRRDVNRGGVLQNEPRKRRPAHDDAPSLRHGKDTACRKDSLKEALRFNGAIPSLCSANPVNLCNTLT